MLVSELIAELEKVPGDAWVDAMFPDGEAAFTVTGAEVMTLPDGRNFCIIDIVDNVPLRAV